jgi:hypothetical protein
VTPHRASGQRGTFLLDRQFSGIGRIRRASGTTDRRVFAGINKMLDTFYERGLFGQLEAIRDGSLKPIAAYAVFRTTRAESVPDAKAMLPLLSTWETWEEETPNADTRRMRRFARVHIEQLATQGSAIAEMASVISRLRPRLVKQPPTFNRVRASALAFLKTTLGKGHPAYVAVRDIEGMHEDTVQRSAPTVAKAIAVRRALPASAAALWWSMATTGMGPKEIDGDWSVGTDRVEVHGRKRQARDRIIPRVSTPTRREIGWKQFREILRALPVETRVQPYDGRRAYAHLLEQAGIARTRRRMYLGHAVGDVTDRYETADLVAFLGEDAGKISALLETEEERAAKSGQDTTPERPRKGRKP